MRYVVTPKYNMTHICVGNLTIIGSDYGFVPGRRQTITRSNAHVLPVGPLHLLPMGPLGTNFGETWTNADLLSIEPILNKISVKIGTTF